MVRQQAAAGGGGGGKSKTKTHTGVQHISGYTPPPSSDLGTPTVPAGTILPGTQAIPGWSTQDDLVQATQGGVYFGGGNKDQSSKEASAAHASTVPFVALMASTAGAVFTLTA